MHFSVRLKKGGPAVVTMPPMRALLLESPADTSAAWLQDLADEFIEDPQCRLALFGGDASGAVLVSLWSRTVVDEVVGGLRPLLPPGASLRVLALADGGFDGTPMPETVRQ